MNNISSSRVYSGRVLTTPVKLSAAEKLDGQYGDWMSAWMQTNDEAITQEEEEPRRYEKDEGKRGKASHVSWGRK